MQEYVKSIDTPDEKRDFPQGKLELVNLAGLMFGRGTFQPGWRWTTSLKEIAGTDMCMVPHKGYIVSGHMTIEMADGTRIECGPGDVFVADPGHDAWVVGDEPCVAFDFSGGMGDYART